MTANLTTEPTLQTTHALVEAAFRTIHTTSAAITATAAQAVNAQLYGYAQTAPMPSDYADDNQYQQAMADWADVHDRMQAHFERLLSMAGAYAQAANDLSLPDLADDTNEGAASVLEAFGNTLANYAMQAELDLHPEYEDMADEYDWQDDLDTDYYEETPVSPAV